MGINMNDCMPNSSSAKASFITFHYPDASIKMTINVKSLKEGMYGKESL